MSIALITDIHYGVRSDSSVFYDYYKKFNDIFFQKIDEEGIKTVALLGDLLDRRKFVNFITSSRARKDLLEPLNERNIDVHVIAGNHDIFYKNTSEVSSLKELLKPYNFHVYFEPQEVIIEDTKILMLPWITDSNAEKSFDLIKSTNAEICFGHLEIEGFEMDRGRFSDHGLNRSTFEKFDIVASGHFHHKSIQGNIHYLGAPYEQDWSDYGDTKGFHIFDLQTREFEFIMNPHNIFHMIKYDDLENPEKIRNLIKNADFSRFENAFVKVLCLNRNDSFLFDQFMEKINKENPFELTVIEDASNFTELDPEGEIETVEDTMSLLDKYIDGLEINLDNNKLKRHMREIYTEAMSLESISVC